MPGQGRLGDIGKIDSDAHGCPACPHPAQGPAITGSPDVFVNGLPALRETDMGVHAVCCGPNMWQATGKSPDVFINSLGAHRKDDDQLHCGGQGKLNTASSDVITNS